VVCCCDFSQIASRQLLTSTTGKGSLELPSGTTLNTWGEHAYRTDKASDPSAKPSTAVGKKVEVPVLSRFGKENHNMDFKFQNFYFYVLYVCNLTAILDSVTV